MSCIILHSYRRIDIETCLLTKFEADKKNGITLMMITIRTWK
jgi:hypothetical protein